MDAKYRLYMLTEARGIPDHWPVPTLIYKNLDLDYAKLILRDEAKYITRRGYPVYDTGYSFSYSDGYGQTIKYFLKRERA